MYSDTWTQSTVYCISLYNNEKHYNPNPGHGREVKEDWGRVQKEPQSYNLSVKDKDLKQVQDQVDIW